jgi:hypothetical protein
VRSSTQSAVDLLLMIVVSSSSPGLAKVSESDEGMWVEIGASATRRPACRRRHPTTAIFT